VTCGSLYCGVPQLTAADPSQHEDSTMVMFCSHETIDQDEI